MNYESVFQDGEKRSPSSIMDEVIGLSDQKNTSGGISPEIRHCTQYWIYIHVSVYIATHPFNNQDLKRYNLHMGNWGPEAEFPLIHISMLMS